MVDSGPVVAYGPGNVELGRAPFNLIQTCTDATPWLREAPATMSKGLSTAASAPYTSPYAPFAEAVLPIPSVSPASLAADIEWEVVALDTLLVCTVPPDSVRRGASSSFVVPLANISPGRFRRIVNARGDTVTDPGRWPVLHKGALNKKALAYRITAKVTVDGRTVRSSPVIVQQDEIDTMREEYVEFGQQRVLDRTEFGTFGDPLRNVTGDYTVWPSGPRLVDKMPIMQQLAIRRFGRPITVMSGYRNPVHHFLHAGATAVNSQHLYGLATDWVITLPSARPNGMSKEQWFTELWRLTRDSSVDGCWEPAAEIIRTSSRTPALQSLNHAHSDWREMTDTSCVPAWRLR